MNKAVRQGVSGKRADRSRKIGGYTQISSLNIIILRNRVNKGFPGLTMDETWSKKKGVAALF